jgi:hypothetical protein
MKMTGRGAITILVFFIGLPVFVDMILLMFLKKNKDVAGFSIFTITAFIKYLPLYLLYLVIAFFVLRLIDRVKRGKKITPDFEFEAKDTFSPKADDET